MKAFNTAAVTRAKSVWLADRVHKLGAVPATPATPYLIVSVTSQRPDNVRGDGDHGSAGYRAIAQAVGRTYDEVAFAVEKSDVAFLEGALVVPGYDVTPVAGDELVSSPVIRDPDDNGLLTCTVIYPFHAFPTA